MKNFREKKSLHEIRRSILTIFELAKFLTVKGVEGSKMSSGRGQWPAKVFNEFYEEKKLFSEFIT